VRSLERRRLGWVLAGLGTVGACVSVATVAGASTSGRAPVPSLTGQATRAVAPTSGSTTGSAAEETRAARWLTRAARAERGRSYAGTQYVCAWHGDTSASYIVDLEHRPGEGTIARVHASAGGPVNAVYEAEPVPKTVDPLTIPSIGTGPLDLLRSNYELTVGPSPTGQVEIVARRTADGSVAGRFWIDRSSGLLVRREVIDAAGRLARASAFVSLEVGPVAMPAARPSPEPTASGDVLDPAALDALRGASWVLPATLPAGMVLYDARQTSIDGADVVHLGYSDGISTMSVFVQRGHLDTGEFGQWQRWDLGGPVYVRADGLSERMAWDGHGHVYTVVSDAPGSVVDSAVETLPHGTDHAGITGRIGHGLSRLGGWVNPFG
jgi:sigma-E factor negative regulatory protein RseB